MWLFITEVILVTGTINLLQRSGTMNLIGICATAYTIHICTLVFLFIFWKSWPNDQWVIVDESWYIDVWPASFIQRNDVGNTSKNRSNVICTAVFLVSSAIHLTTLERKVLVAQFTTNYVFLIVHFSQEIEISIKSYFNLHWFISHSHLLGFYSKFLKWVLHKCCWNWNHVNTWCFI